MAYEGVPAWVAGYVGIPFVPYGRTREAIDCWGMVALVLREQYGIILPDYQYKTPESLEDIPSVAQNFYDATATDLWNQVADGEEQAGDVVLIRVGGYPRHCGIIVAAGVMLHAMENIGSCIDGYRGVRHRHHLAGFYRYGGSP